MRRQQQQQQQQQRGLCGGLLLVLARQGLPSPGELSMRHIIPWFANVYFGWHGHNHGKEVDGFVRRD